MLLAVMGSSSYLKRPWDDTDEERSSHQGVGVSAATTNSARRFSIDQSSPIDQQQPPIFRSRERPSHILRQHSWTTNADPEETSTGRLSPPAHTEGSAKRPRLFYDQKEPTSAERFDLKSLTANSSVRTSNSISRGQQCHAPLACDHS